MNCCSVIIKIKDFLPKLSKIPYENYICIFTNNEFEGRISLMQYEYQHINHEIKDIKSDIIYKIKVIDLISKKIIGISEHCLKFDIINNLNIGTSINIINQIRILSTQTNKPKISSNLNSYNNNLTLTISTEIIKFNKTPINYIIKENSEFLKLNLKFHPNNISRKKPSINSLKLEDSNNYNTKNNLSVNEGNINDIYNKKKKDLFNEEDKNNINLNMHNITVQNYYTINSSPPLNLNSVKNNKIYIKKNFKKNKETKGIQNQEKKKNEINYNKIRVKKGYQSSTLNTKIKSDKDFFNSFESEEQCNLTNKSIKVGRKMIFKRRKKLYNNNSYKEIKYSRKNKSSISVDSIQINKNNYINTSLKKKYHKISIDNDRINTLEISSYNMTYNSNSNSFITNQKYNNKLESIISPKNSNSKKDFKSELLSMNNLPERLRYNKSKDNINNLKHIHLFNIKTKSENYLKKKNNRYRIQCKKNIISLLEFYILLNRKMKKLNESYQLLKSKYFWQKEKMLNIIDKKNILERKKTDNKIKRYIYVNINSKINNQFFNRMKNIKKKEFNIFEKIFKISINKDDILNQINKDKLTHNEEINKISLYLDLIKNIIKNYGNISQIYNNNINKKCHLLNLLINNGIEINSSEILYIKKKSNYKEIKEEIKEELEEESVIDKDIKEQNDLNQSITNAKDDIRGSILDKILISEFPLKYGNITKLKFSKINSNSNEYLFNNELKIFAFYNKGEVSLKLENVNNNINKEYTLDEFINNFVKNRNEGKNNKSELINLQKNKLKINREKYSRNHKIMNEIAFKGEKKVINNENDIKLKKE